MVALGVHWQSASSPLQDLVQKHQSSLPLYLSLIVGEWLLVYFVWAGLKRGNTIKLIDLIGGKWDNWKKIPWDRYIFLDSLVRNRMDCEIYPRT